jgi:Fe-S cluster biogenesis protein NfuA/nitrite reductase/ring-hydroxylating ferredoxin subunit
MAIDDGRPRRPAPPPRTGGGNGARGARGGPGRPDPGPEELVERTRELIGRLDELDDPVARATAQELAVSLLGLYGEGLRRLLALLEGAGEAGSAIRRGMADDGVLASLLLIHGLYPVDLATRVREALDSVRPYLASHGGDVELVALGDDGVARLRLVGSCDGCPGSAATLELAIEQALATAAPDLGGLEVEGLDPAPEPAPSAGRSASLGRTAWIGVDGLGDLAPGSARTVEVLDARLYVANVDGTLLGYVSTCAGCGAPLDGAVVSAGGVLACPGCERRFELTRAGRAVGDDAVHLTAVPLLADEAAGVKVALAV